MFFLTLSFSSQKEAKNLKNKRANIIEIRQLSHYPLMIIDIASLYINVIYSKNVTTFTSFFFKIIYILYLIDWIS